MHVIPQRKEVTNVRSTREQKSKNRYEKPELMDLGAVVKLTGA